MAGVRKCREDEEHEAKCASDRQLNLCKHAQSTQLSVAITTLCGSSEMAIASISKMDAPACVSLNVSKSRRPLHRFRSIPSSDDPHTCKGKHMTLFIAPRVLAV